MSVIKGRGIAYSPSIAANPSVAPFASVPWPNELVPPAPPINPDDIPNLNYWLNFANPATVSYNVTTGDISLVESDGTVASGSVSQATDVLSYTYLAAGTPPFAAMAPGRSPWMTLGSGGGTSNWWCFVFSAGFSGTMFGGIDLYGAPLIVPNDTVSGCIEYGSGPNLDAYRDAVLLNDTDQMLMQNLHVGVDQARHILEINTDGLGGVGDVYLDGVIIPMEVFFNNFVAFTRIGCSDGLWPEGAVGSQLCEILQASSNIPDEMRPGLYSYLKPKWGVV